MTISVAVADDQALVRVGFCGIIAATDGLTVVGEAANGSEAVAAAPESSGVRVIILTTFDLDEYVFGALRAGASGFLLKDTLPADLITAIRVVAAGEALLAPSITRRLISEFARIPPLGTSGPVRSSLPTPARGGVGGSRLPAGAAGPRLSGGAGQPTSWPTRASMPTEVASPRGHQVTALLTDRECEVLRLVAAGLSNAEIANHLRISPATAKTHVAHLLTKLDSRDRVQLVIIAYQAGLTGC
jgi:DNA-binding NarL/FixJ family response regulator